VNRPNPSLRRVGIISFSIAILLGVLIIVVRAVPDMESTMYGFIKFGYPRLTTLSCPVLMTTLDRLPVTMSLHNSLDKPFGLYVNAQLSTFVAFVTSEERLNLLPGETRSFSWEVGQENIDLHNFIFARVFTSAATASGMREATCGTLVLNLPFKGGPVIFYVSLVLSVLTGAIGLGLWPRHSDLADPGVVTQAWWMRSVALEVAVGIIAVILHLWFIGIITILLTLLTLSVFLLQGKV
jgi:hypothetical protein